jgi:hypothetical protein
MRGSMAFVMNAGARAAPGEKLAYCDETGAKNLCAGPLSLTAWRVLTINKTAMNAEEGKRRRTAR